MTEAKNATAQIRAFLGKYSSEIASRAQTILKKMRVRYPTALELVYDNYNALAIGFSPTERPSEVIFSIVLYPNWVSLFFLQAKGLPDPKDLLQGTGKQVAHIRLPTPDTLDDPAVAALMQEAAARAKVPFDPKGRHRLIIRSVSAKQRPRRPAESSSTRRIRSKAAKS
ncbi:MAG: hypothetical protein ACYCOR_01925 [Acidobacteriaceae bacterium]